MAPLAGRASFTVFLLLGMALAVLVAVCLGALTAHALKEDRARCLAAGSDDCIPQLLRTEDLPAAIARWTAVEAAA